MGACKSKDKPSHHTHENNKDNKKEVIVASTISKPSQGDNKFEQGSERPAMVKSEIKVDKSPENNTGKKPVPQKYKLRFILGEITLDEGVFQGDQQLSSLTSPLKSKLEVGKDYDFLLINPVSNSKQDITKRTNEVLKNLFPAGDPETYVNVIELVYAGLDVSADTRRAYAESTQIVASPKYDSAPFEIISFNKSTNGLSYQLYQDESFNYLKSFNEFSAYCNGNNKLYISGSDKKNEDETYNSLFVEIDLNNLNKPNHIKQLPNLITGRGWHSMIFVPPRNVFIVGGINTKSVELYDTIKNQITHDSNLNENRSETTLCCLNNAYLYAFCGFLLNNNFINSIEKCNLKSRTRTWEIVNLIMEQSCSFEPSFFSVAYGKGNSIVLLGGNENQRSISKNYKFESKDGIDTITNYQINPVEDFYLCSEKFFMPINEKASILMPVYTSEVVKILLFDSEAANLSVIKFEVLETAEDDIRESIGYQIGENKLEDNPLQRLHEEVKKENI